MYLRSESRRSLFSHQQYGIARKKATRRLSRREVKAMKLIPQNGQQFRNRFASTDTLTSVNVSPPVDFLRRKNTAEDGGELAIFHLRLIRRYKVFLFVRRLRRTKRQIQITSKLIPCRAIVRRSRVLNI